MDGQLQSQTNDRGAPEIAAGQAAADAAALLRTDVRQHAWRLIIDRRT